MTESGTKRPKPGTRVVLTELPPGLSNGLPIEDQRAISEAVGRPVLLNEYDEDGRAELQFNRRGSPEAMP
jgi:hypothetical protein